MTPALRAITGARNAISRSRNDSTTTPPMNSGMRLGDVVALVDERSVEAADVDARRCEVAKVAHELRRRAVLRRGPRYEGNERRLPVWAHPRRG